VAEDGSVIAENVFVTRVGAPEPVTEETQVAVTEAPSLRGLALDYADALRAGDEARARATAHLAETDLGPAGVRARVVAPAMHWIGALWEAGSLSVAQERVATSITERVLAEIALGEAPGGGRARARRRDRPGAARPGCADRRALRSQHPEVEVIVGGAGLPADLRSSGLCTWVSDAEALARLLAGRPPGQLPSRSAGRTSSR